MTVQDVVRILRARWKMICAVILVALVGGLAYALVQTPHYKASTRLFVSTTSNDNNTQANDGAFFAQRRAITYTKLLTGDLLAQRTIDKLGLHMTVAKLQEEITAAVPPETVLIDIDVLDPSPVRARDIANALADEFVIVASGLETPDPSLQPNARIVVQERAIIPQRPASGGKVKVLGLAFVLGSALGVFAAVTRHLLDRTLKYSDEVEKVLGVGGLGEIPLAAKSSEPSSEPSYIYWGSNSSDVADAFRAMRTNIQFAEVGKAAEVPRVLVVASALPGEGKTTTALNLSMALAESNYEVVVVDADLRNPKVAQALDLAEPLGLSSVLTGVTSLQSALQETRIPRVTALTSGPLPTDATELLGSRATAGVISELGNLYDYVIVDSPSLLVADAAILAGNSQGLLIVVKYGHTKGKQLAEAMAKVERTGAPLFGSLLMMTPAKKAKRDKKRKEDKPSATRRRRRGSHNKRRIAD